MDNILARGCVVLTTSSGHYISLLLLQLLLLLMQMLRPTGAACNEEEVDRCRKAAMKNSLMDLDSGGRCKPQAYGDFTHSCLLNQYDPDADHCCCPLGNKVLCCSYHQSGTHFRCNEAQDVASVGGRHSVSSYSDSDTDTVVANEPAALASSSSSSHRSQELAVETWAAIIIGGVVGLILIAGIAVFIYRRYKRRRKHLEKKKKNTHRVEHQQSTEEAVPLSELAAELSPDVVPAGDNSNPKVLFYMPSQDASEGPTAPPLFDETGEGSDEVFPLPGEGMTHVCSRCQNVRLPSYSRSASYPEGEEHVSHSPRPRFHSCASCPPPSYDEHHQHRVIP